VQILITGSLAYDRIMEFPGRFGDHILPEKIHILNVCFTVEGLQENFGGTAGNIAYNLALLGEKPLVVAAVGRDFGRYRRWMEEHKLPLTGVREVQQEFTAGAYITTDKDDNQITGFNPGAMKHPAAYSLDGCDAADTLAIISPGNAEDMLGYSRQYKERGIRYIFDPGQQIPILPPDDLAEMVDGAHILISNDYELEMIQKATGMSKDQVIAKTGCLITTLGEKGSIICEGSPDEVRVGAAKARRVKDPTGAGDAYRAGLIKGLVTGRTMEQAAALGAVCASFAVEELGTQEHSFSQQEFSARHQEAFGPL
jgi:adenosine kinase